MNGRWVIGASIIHFSRAGPTNAHHLEKTSILIAPAAPLMTRRPPQVRASRGRGDDAVRGGRCPTGRGVHRGRAVRSEGWVVYFASPAGAWGSRRR